LPSTQVSMLQPLVVECDNRSEVAADGGALSGTRAELFVARQDGARRIGVGFHRAEHVTRLRVAIANVLLAGGFTTAIGTLRLLHQQTCQDYTRHETCLQRRHIASLLQQQAARVIRLSLR